MSSQELVGESRVSSQVSDAGTKSKQWCWPLWAINGGRDGGRLEKDRCHGGGSRSYFPFPSQIHNGELRSSATPTSFIPSNVKFLSYENMKKSVTCSPEAMQHPWVKGALAVTGKLCKENMDLKQQVNKLEEQNHILRGIITKKITTPTLKKET